MRWRALVLGLAMARPVLAAELAPGAPAELVAAWDEAERYPEDYAALAALAYAAEDSDPALAVRTWERAEVLAAGNYETTAGKVRPLLALGEVGPARRAAREAVSRAPDSTLAHLLLLEALAAPLPWDAPERAAWERTRTARAAIDLGPDEPAPWCGLGWSHLARLDRTSARRAFSRAEDRGGSCGSEAARASEPFTRASGGAWLVGVADPTRADASTHGLVVLSASALARDRWTLTATGRTSTDAPLSAYLDAWGRAGLHSGELGAVVIAGGMWEPGTVPGLALRGGVVGGRAWLTRWITLRADLARSRYDDGSGWQGDLGLSVPALSLLVVDAGVQVTTFATSTGVAAHLDLRVRRGGTALVLGGRVGREHRPVRMDALYAWDLPLRGGASLALEVPASRGLALSAGAEVYRLDGPADPPSQILGMIYAGLTATRWEDP